MATIEIDDDVYEALQVPEAERSQAMKQELAFRYTLAVSSRSAKRVN